MHGFGKVIYMANKKTRTTTEHSFTVIYEMVGKKAYQVMVPVLPGLVTYGRSFEEARKMAREAITCYLEALKKDKELIPAEHSFLQERVTIMV